MSNITEVLPRLGTVPLCLLSGFTSVIVSAPFAQAGTITSVDFLGISEFPTGLQFNETEVGGLSGITYDANNNVYYTIADDRSEDARFYTLTIELNQNSLGAVEFTNVTKLRNENGEPVVPLSFDPEGIALTTNGTLFISSEGDASRQTSPFVNEFALTGQQLQALPIPEKFLPTATQVSGIRNNAAFESLTITPNQNYLFTATENALYQDGPAATTTTGSPSRILKYNLSTEQPEAEFLYLTDPVAAAPEPATEFSTNGLVDLLALDSNSFLSLERSFSVGVGNTIKLYETSLQGADDISSIDSLIAAGDLDTIKPAQKKLLLDLSELNITLDNIEGLTFGPDLADGRRSLILVSDNNFSSTQTTQVLAFGVRTEPVPEPSATAGLGLLTVLGLVAKLRCSK